MNDKDEIKKIAFELYIDLERQFIRAVKTKNVTSDVIKKELLKLIIDYL